MKMLSFVATFVLAIVIGASSPGCSKNKPTEGEKGEKLGVSANNVSVKPGENADLTVKIERTKFSDPVEISFSDLPKGVTIDPATAKIDKDKTDTKFKVKADADAAAVDGKEAKVTGKGGSLSNTGTFKITVTKK